MMSTGTVTLILSGDRAFFQSVTYESELLHASTLAAQDLAKPISMTALNLILNLACSRVGL